MSELRYQLFPRSFGMNKAIEDVVNCFDKHHKHFKSPDFTLSSNQVLKMLEPDLKSIGFVVEESKAS